MRPGSETHTHVHNYYQVSLAVPVEGLCVPLFSQSVSHSFFVELAVAAPAAKGLAAGFRVDFLVCVPNEVSVPEGALGFGQTANSRASSTTGVPNIPPSFRN